MGEVLADPLCQLQPGFVFGGLLDHLGDQGLQKQGGPVAARQGGDGRLPHLDQRECVKNPLDDPHPGGLPIVDPGMIPAQASVKPEYFAFVTVGQRQNPVPGDLGRLGQAKGHRGLPVARLGGDLDLAALVQPFHQLGVEPPFGEVGGRPFGRVLPFLAVFLGQFLGDLGEQGLGLCPVPALLHSVADHLVPRGGRPQIPVLTVGAGTPLEFAALAGLHGKCLDEALFVGLCPSFLGDVSGLVVGVHKGASGFLEFFTKALA